MIDCVTLKSCHQFPSNPLASMARLRYRSVIERQSWDVPTWDGMEYDSYDNPATTYFLWRDAACEVRACARLYPTDRPYMLQQAFAHLVTNDTLPSDIRVREGSRLCVDKNLPAELRRTILRELVVAYMEFGLANGIDKIVGVMLPAYWKSVYINAGWRPVWYGEAATLPNGDRVRAAALPVNAAMMSNIQEVTGIRDSVLNYGITMPDFAIRMPAILSAEACAA